MKILLVGNLSILGRTSQRLRALKDLGHKVSAISSHNSNKLKYSFPFSTRVFLKLGYPLDTEQANDKILDMVSKNQFDLVWIEKSLMIKPNTLKKIREYNKKVVLVFYSEDNMYLRHNQSAYFKKSIPLYDIIFTTKSSNCLSNELPALGAKKIVFVEKAFDSYQHKPIKITIKDIEIFGGDVGFIGTFEKSRAERMLFLAENNIRVRVWGNEWNHWVNKNPNLIIENKPLFSDDYIKSICATKINLCFLRKANFDLQTDRTMEIPACGGFMLAERTSEHLKLFQEDIEAAFFDIDNIQELLKKVIFYLNNEDNRMSIAKAGRERCLSSKYSHHDRLKYMLSHI